MARSAVDHGVTGHVVAVVDHDGPDVDKKEKENVHALLEREHKGEHVVRDALQEAVNWVEGMGGKRRGNNPLVMRFVQNLVDALVVKAAVDQVDAEISKHDEERELGPQDPRGVVLEFPVELGVTMEL